MRKPKSVLITPDGYTFRNGNVTWDYGYKNFYSHNSDGSEGIWWANLTWDLSAGVRKGHIWVHNQSNYIDDIEECTYDAQITGLEISTTQYGSLTNPFIADMTSGYSDIVVRGFGNIIYVLAAFEYTSPSAGGGLVWASYDIDTDTWTNGYIDSYSGGTFIPSCLDILNDGTDIWMCMRATGTSLNGFYFKSWDLVHTFTRTTTELLYMGISDPTNGYIYFYTTGQKLVRFDADNPIAEFMDVASSITEVPASASYGQCYCYKSADFWYLVTATKVFWSVNGSTDWISSETFTTLYAPIWGSSNELYAIIYDNKYLFLDSLGAIKFFVVEPPALYLGVMYGYECGWHEAEDDYFIRHLFSTLYQLQFVSVNIIGMNYELGWHMAPSCQFAQIDVIEDAEFIRLYDDYNALLIEGYAAKVKSDNNQAFACEIDTRIQTDLDNKINATITGTRKAIATEIIEDWCEELTIGLIELDDITAYTFLYNNKSVTDALDELCQLEGAIDWYFTRNKKIYINNLDTAANFALLDNFNSVSDDYSNIVVNKVTVYGKWIAGVQCVSTSTSGATIYGAIEVQAPTFNQSECEALSANLLTNKNLKYWTYWIDGIFGESLPELGTLINLTWDLLTLDAKACYIKRVIFDGATNFFDIIVTDTFVYKLKEMDEAPVLQQQISDVSATVSSSSHNPVTIGTANGLSLSTQTLSMAAATTSVVGAVQLEDSTSSTSTTNAATPNSVKSAYDLANGKTTLAAVKADADVASAISLKHAAVTVTVARPLRLSTQLISVANDVDAEVTEIDTGTLDTSDTKIPTNGTVKEAVDLKANLTSPTFTGTPILPTGTTGVTQAAGTNNTTLATTAYIDRMNSVGAANATWFPMHFTHSTDSTKISNSNTTIWVVGAVYPVFEATMPLNKGGLKFYCIGFRIANNFGDGSNYVDAESLYGMLYTGRSAALASNTDNLTSAQLKTVTFAAVDCSSYNALCLELTITVAAYIRIAAVEILGYYA